MTKKIIKGIASGILTLIILTSLALALIHSNNFLYQFDIDHLNIPQYSGYSRDLILRNYDATMDFLSPFNNYPFDLPDLEFSESGAIHFEECKVIFNKLYACGVLSLLIFVVLRKKLKDTTILLTSAITTICLPIILLICISIDFNSAFIMFHKLFFGNELWIFNPQFDPIINILPAQFFMHCAIFIASFWIIGACVQLGIYFKLKKNK